MSVSCADVPLDGAPKVAAWRTFWHLLSLILLGMLAQPCVAQQQPEVSIGTFTLGDRGVAIDDRAPSAATRPDYPFSEPVDDPANPDARRWFWQRFEQSLPESAVARTRLLADGEAALASGDIAAAQRAFERLVAEASDTPEASRARRGLAEIYARQDVGKEGNTEGNGGSPSQAALPWSGAQRPALEAEAAADVLGRLRPVARAVEDQFMAEAGDRIFFGAGSTELGARARTVLEAQARFMLRRGELGALIEGHSDDAGIDNEASQKLSADRAAVVRDRLISEGVEPDRIMVLAKGRTDRVAQCGGLECQAQNRRAVTVLRLGLGRGGALPTARMDRSSTAPSSTPN